MFFNECIRAAEGKPKMTQATITQAEVSYSDNRLRALADEWIVDYPNLIELVLFLKQFPKQFHLDQVRSKIEERMLDFLISRPKEDFIFHLVEDKFNNDDTDGFLQEAFYKILFRTGVIGVKQQSYSTIYWSYLGQRLVGEMTEQVTCHIHPAFWRVLGIHPIST